MDRKDFIRKGLMGTGMFITSATIGKALDNDIDEITPLEPIGYNHLPNADSKLAENSVLHKADTRGHANHGWLDSHHSFSFANYHNPDRMHFGVLRVLNDDRVDPGMGFGTHPHDNMEIISIPLEGDLEHKDSMGTTAVIKKGDIQVMSAGTGIQHSEYNKNKDKLTKFLQIWLYPNKHNVTPRYDQITLDVTARHNKLKQILSPNQDDEGVWIHQDAWFHMGQFDNGFTTKYNLKKKGNGIYAFVLKGDISIGSIKLNDRDGLGIWDINTIDITANSQDAEILLMEVPMQL
ncbi:pirin [Flavobacterium rivuli WB 3.3-2 = DSM 21788]|uniref:Pirin n=1 Tax=Flavobacterium rivuli WB 3.3-2 = DSM 21788 TaxID=1121895 RepID=A0A0A2M828_9FLAO|nr:pirin family protein [Flavobacterium rivuli]KGO87766.1 pirin [Flavobacterium rivuli WB 3.3-2 = DSM 21788]